MHDQDSKEPKPVDSFFAQERGDEQAGTAREQSNGGNSAQSSMIESASTEYTEQETRMAAVMAYVPFLCFIPLLNMRQNPEAVFHARQGVILFLIELAAVLFLIDGLSDFIFRGVLVVAAGFSAAGILFAIQGRKYRLPWISDLADKSKL